MKVFSVYDSKAEAFLQPFFMANAQVAIRAMSEAIGDDKSPFCKHPADYTLFEVGKWDDRSGLIESHEVKVNLGTCLELRGRSASNSADLKAI